MNEKKFFFLILYQKRICPWRKQFMCTSKYFFRDANGAAVKFHRNGREKQRTKNKNYLIVKKLNRKILQNTLMNNQKTDNFFLKIRSYIFFNVQSHILNSKRVKKFQEKITSSQKTV